MNNLSAKPLYKQFTGQLVTIFIIAFLTIAFATFLFFERDGQVRTLAEFDYLQWQKYQQTQQLLINQLSLLELMQQNKSVENLLTNHHQLFKNLQLLSALKLPQVSQFESFIVQNEFTKQNVITITNNSARNSQLKESTKIKLQLVIDSLTIEIDKINAQLLNLFQRIINVRATDKIDINRVEAHAKAVHDLGVYQQLSRDFSDILSLFYRLNAHTSITDFTRINKLAVLAFQRYNIFINTDSNQRVVPELSAQLTTLENLLLKEQKTLAKWQEHLRLTQNYLSSFNEQKQLLSNMLRDNKAPELASLNIIPTSISTAFLQTGSTSTSAMQSNLFTFIILFGTLVLIFMLFRFHRGLQLNTSQATLMYQQMVNINKVEKIDYQSAADKKIKKLTGRINELQRSESDYQALEKSYQELMLSITKDQVTATCSENELIETAELIETYEQNSRKLPIDIDIINEDFDEQYLQEQLRNSVTADDDFIKMQAAFDLQHFASIQGSPEIAGYMLDEYLDSNRLHFEKLRQAIKTKELGNAQQNLQEIMLVAQILGAGKLQSICDKLNKALDTKKIRTVNSLVKKMEKALADIKAYAEAI